MEALKALMAIATGVFGGVIVCGLIWAIRPRKKTDLFEEIEADYQKDRARLLKELNKGND